VLCKVLTFLSKTSAYLACIYLTTMWVGTPFEPGCVSQHRYENIYCHKKIIIIATLLNNLIHKKMARYADVLDKKVKTLQSASLYHKLRPNYDNAVFWGIILIYWIKIQYFFFKTKQVPFYKELWETINFNKLKL
jgi:hypothetical protein